ncbi:hypothetical protein [Paracraurococcus lichenis]|uniref:Uncharacterized protein n=1 Tax=Paracraurococcus lichenis TaxID=3064888 RepID=A0ABT9EC23_9PROT|nr:hypothetical protein [Paracraurococcus sp. LOR1-02]MDO9713585.1 hypothetical protein [Paracraurococcus sp. LOR1-02]
MRNARRRWSRWGTPWPIACQAMGVLSTALFRAMSRLLYLEQPVPWRAADHALALARADKSGKSDLARWILAIPTALEQRAREVASHRSGQAAINTAPTDDAWPLENRRLPPIIAIEAEDIAAAEAGREPHF